MTPPLTAASVRPLAEASSATLMVPIHVPRGFDHAALPSLVKAVDNAVTLLAKSREGNVVARADVLAQLAAGMVEPQLELVEDRLRRMQTVKEVLADGEWLTAEQINVLQPNPPTNKSLPASDWKRRGRVFSVSHAGKEFFARYQFDATYQPLPIVKEVLTAFGEVADAWVLAAWFHFPNTWLAHKGRRKGMEPVAPKDALDAGAAVVSAAAKRLRSYVA